MYLYILSNNVANKYYIGITENLQRRLVEHNSYQKHYTGRMKGDWELLYSKQFNSKIEARQEELRLKKAKNKIYLAWYILNSGP